MAMRIFMMFSLFVSNKQRIQDRSTDLRDMAHVYAARGGGYFLNTISAAGRLSQVGSPAYSTQNMRGSSRKLLSSFRTLRCWATCARRQRITTAGYQGMARIQAKMQEAYGKS